MPRALGRAADNTRGKSKRAAEALGWKERAVEGRKLPFADNVTAGLGAYCRWWSTVHGGDRRAGK